MKRTTLGLFRSRFAMILDARSSSRRTSTYTWDPILGKICTLISTWKVDFFEDLQVASSAAESPPPMTARGLFLDSKQGLATFLKSKTFKKLTGK